MSTTTNFRETTVLAATLFLACIACHIKLAHGQCSGTTLVLIGNATYQTFTSPNYPFNYPNNLNCMWLIQTENITDAIRLDVVDAAIEYHADCAYDMAEVFDGPNATADSLGKFCGISKPIYVSSGNYLTVTFTSDYSLSSRGFKGKYKSGDRDSLLDDREETHKLDFVVIAVAGVGVAILLFTISAAVYACHQVKKAKRSRTVRALEPQDALPAYQLEYIRPSGPPSYSDFYDSPMSPPPAYCEVDPNPPPGPFNTYRIHMRNDMHNANDRGRLGHDVNANTHFIRPGYTRGTANHSLVLNSEPNSQMGTTLSPRFLQRLQVEPQLQSNNNDHDQNPQVTENQQANELSNQVPNAVTPLEQTNSVNSTTVSGDTLNPRGAVVRTESVRAATGLNGIMSMQGPVAGSSLERRASDVSDISLPPSHYSGESPSDEEGANM